MATPALAASSRIAFRRLKDTGASIFTIRAEGTGLRLVTHHPKGVVDSDPAWSPDRRWIAYSVYVNGSQDDSSISEVHPNGTGRTSLSGGCSDPCITQLAPAWSPDGTQIAYTEGLGAAGDVNVKAILIMDANGTNPVQVTQQGTATDTASRFSDYFPAWSPDGQSLAFSRTDEHRGISAIFAVNVDGTGLHRVTAWHRDAAGADWSPNGHWILFRTQESSDVHGRLAIVHPDGSGLRVITPPGGKMGSSVVLTEWKAGRRRALPGGRRS